MMMKKLYSSRKNSLFGIIIPLFFCVGLSSSAQQIITEHNSIPLDGSIKYEPGFDENSYTKTLDFNGNRIFVKNQSSIQNRLQNENTVNDVNLTLNFGFDASQFFVGSVTIFNESGYMHSWTYEDLPEPFVIAIPTGSYDIITEFGSTNDSGNSHVIIKETESIQANSSIQINLSDADNYVSIIGYDENGDNFDSAIGGYLIFDRAFYFNPMNLVATVDSYFTSPQPEQNPEWNFYINDVSERYSIVQKLIASGFNQGNYFTKFPTLTGLTESSVVANNPANWSYHEEFFQSTQISNTSAPAYFYASTFNGILMTGWASSAGGTINPGDAPFRGFINNRLDDDPADLIVIPAIIDTYVSFSPTTGGIEYLTKGNPVFSDGNGGVIYGSGDISSNSHSDPNYATIPYVGDDYYVLANNEIKLLPFHSRFSFDPSTATSPVLGNNVPITVTESRANNLKITYKGRYGETRETDYLATQLEVKQNESLVFSGYLEDYPNSSFPSSGNINIKLTNNNTQVDGLQGINTTTITYDASAADAPPTLQHLQFRNSDNQVTINLNSNEGATIRLAAGDFMYNSNAENNGYYSYEAGNSVTLSYSLYNQNSWTDLELTEHPEYFQMPAFGDYYEAPLSSIQNQNANQWYDIRVICTDTAGNTQEQVISPAFKINQTLGIEDFSESNFVVYPNPFSNQLNIVLSEIVNGSYTFKITDLTGRIIYNRVQSERSFGWNASFLSAGFYILSIENNGKLSTKKVIKR